MEILCNNKNSESFKSITEQTSTPTDIASSLPIAFSQINNKELLRSKIKFTTDYNSTPSKSKKLKSDRSSTAITTTHKSSSNVIPVKVDKVEDKVETKELFCICRRSSDEDEDDDDMMIECEVCKDWLHGK